jgi:site-specific DNA recombinase
VNQAAIYARRSTAEQDASIDRQVTECKRFIESRGWQGAEIYADTASGWKADARRPHFESMMQAARCGGFDALVVWEVSRLSRREGEDSALATIWRLRKLGVEVHSVIEPSTGINLADDLTLLIRSHLAKEESDTKSKRVRSGKRRGLLEGVQQGREAPYGYDRGVYRPFEGRRQMIKFYEPDPITGPTVREVFTSYVDGRMSPQQIADMLDARGVPPPFPDMWNPLKRRGKPTWHQSTIRDLLRNPTLAGFVTHRKHRIKGCSCADFDELTTWAMWEVCDHAWVRSINLSGVIDIELWDRAQETMTARARPHMKGRGHHAGNERFLLAGLLWCGRCGERITTRRAQRANDIDRYICQGRRIGRCDQPRFPKEDVDDAVRRYFIDNFVDSEDVQTTIDRERGRISAARGDEARTIKEEIADVERELGEANAFRRRLQLDYERGSLRADQWSRLDADCASRILQAQDALGRLQARLTTTEAALSMEELSATLEQLDSVGRMIQGDLTDEDIPALNERLHEVFDSFVVTHGGDRVSVEPRMNAGWLPKGNWHILDFGTDDHGGNRVVEVIEHLHADLRRAELLDLIPRPGRFG